MPYNQLEYWKTDLFNNAQIITQTERLCDRTSDHVHILISIPPKYSVSQVVGRSRYRGGKTKTLQICKAGDYFEKKLENKP